MSTTTFTTSRRQLADILARIADTTPTRSPKPILQDVKISVTDDGKVSFYATNLERCHTETFEVNEWTGPPYRSVRERKAATEGGNVQQIERDHYIHR